MKYMILSNGKEFIVKINDLIRWYTLKEENLYGHFYIIHFKSEQEAEKYVRKTYGTSAKRIRKWRII